MIALVYTLIVLVTITGDQLLKAYITANFTLGSVQTLIPKVLSLTYLRNEGGAGNILSGKMWLFYLISAIVIPVIIYYLVKTHKPHDWVFKLGLAFLLGGIIGNLIDRLRFHYVIDMLQLDFINFNIFNIADSAISVGIFLVFIYLIFIDREEK